MGKDSSLYQEARSLQSQKIGIKVELHHLQQLGPEKYPELQTGNTLLRFKRQGNIRYPLLLHSFKVEKGEKVIDLPFLDDCPIRLVEANNLIEGRSVVLDISRGVYLSFKDERLRAFQGMPEAVLTLQKLTNSGNDHFKRSMRRALSSGNDFYIRMNGSIHRAYLNDYYELSKIKDNRLSTHIKMSPEIFNGIPDLQEGYLRNDCLRERKIHSRLPVDSGVLIGLLSGGYSVLRNYIDIDESELMLRPITRSRVGEGDSEPITGQTARVFSNLKYIDMKPENEQYLVNQLKYLGLKADSIMKDLKAENRKDGQFNLSASETFKTAFGNKPIDFDLHFNKVKDMVYLNGYTGKANGQEIISAAGKNSFTAKELLNLSEGRAVYRTGLKNKEGENYNAWSQLKPDGNEKMKMQTYTEAYGFDLNDSINQLKTTLSFARGLSKEGESFDLKKAIENNPVLSGNTTYIENFKKDLIKGNSATLVLNDGNTEKTIFVEASPQFKGLDLKTGANQKLLVNKHENFKSTDDFRLKVNAENREAIYNGKLEKVVAQNLTKLIPDKICDVDMPEKKKLQLLAKGKVNLNKETVLKVNSEGKIEVGRVGANFDLNKSVLKIGQVSYSKVEPVLRSVKV